MSEALPIIAWRYQDARGHYRYRGYVPNFGVEYRALRPTPLCDHVAASARIAELEALLAESQAALSKASRDLMEVSLEARGLGNPAMPSLELHAAEAGWVSVKDGMPASGATVLACYLNSAGKMRRIRAAWIAAKTSESSPESDIGEYDEDAGMYYDPEDWYEQIDNWPEYTAVTVCDGVITHWMPLPALPEPGQQGRASSAGAERSDEQILPRAPGESAYPGHATSGREGATPSDGANP